MLNFLQAKRRDFVAERVSLLVLQPTPFCNIQCDYCYLPDRDVSKRLSKNTFRTTLERVLSAFVTDDNLSMVWHAGEPLALPVAYYEDLFTIFEEQPYSRLKIRHSIQTNGVLISDEWCAFFRRHQVNVGMSIDGPAFVHDAHRVDRSGRGTHQRVMAGARLLQEHQIDFHVIAVVTRQSLAFADQIFDFFFELGISRLGFNIEELEGEHITSTLLERSTDAPLKAFWTRLYERQQSCGDKIRIREFDNALARIMQDSQRSFGADEAMRVNPQLSPFSILSVDYLGNVSTFSPELLGAKSVHYGDFNFGNVTDNTIEQIIRGPKFQRMLTDIYDGVKVCKSKCQYFRLCAGGAPANKYFENGTFKSSETMYCRTSIQMPVDVLLADLERRYVT